MKPRYLLLIPFIFMFYSLLFSQTPSQLFQQALLKENGEGDLKGAIKIYEKIVQDKIAEREIQAKAQLHIGMCWEKMGKEEAIAAYKLVVEKFNDQPEVVHEAQARLTNLGQAQSTAPVIIQPKYKKLADIEGWFNQADCSPNNQWIVTDAYSEDKFKAWIINRTTLEKRKLDDVERCWVRWSPSGDNISYPGSFTEANEGGLWLTPMDQNTGHVTGESFFIPTHAILHTYDWHPDGKRVCFVENQQWSLGILNIATREIEILLKDRLPKFNPKWRADGEVIYYFTPKGITSLNVKLKQEEVISEGALLDVTLDGDFAVILNMKDPQDALRILSLKSGKHVLVNLRENQLQKTRTTFSNDAKSLLVPSWHEYYVIRSVNLTTGTVSSISDEKGGFSQPRISPLGNQMIYQEWLPSKNTLHVRNTNDDSEELIPLSELFSRPSWSPNGRFVAYRRDGSPKEGVRFFDVNKREVVAVADHEKVSWERINWSKDSQMIAYVAEEDSLSIIHVADIQSNTREITSSKNELSTADWLDQNRKLVYAKQENGRFIIIVHTLASGQTKTICQTDMRLSAPVVSPDERWFVVFGTPKGSKNGQFYICPTEGGELKSIGPTKPSYIEEDFVYWLPDSKHVTALIYEGESTTTHLHVMKIDGSDDCIVTQTDNSYKLEYSLSPDGSIAFYDAMIMTDGILSEVDISEAVEKLK